MRRYSTLPVRRSTREMVDIFGGYNHNLRIGDGEFFDMKNMTSDYYPVLSPRKRRKLYEAPEAARGLIAKDKLCYVDCTAFVIGTERVELGLDAGTDEPKQLISMGAHVIILPDKKYVNTVDISDCGSIEASFVSSGEVKLELCTITGDPYAVKTVSDTAPKEPKDLELWIDTSSQPHGLKKYSAASGLWVSIATTYIKISAKGIGKPFKQYDGVEISGIEVEGIEELNASMVIWDRGDDYIVVVGILDEVAKQTKSVTVKREMPEMDYVIESGNRLWGCRYGKVNGEMVNEIYACKLGDFRNWSCYMNLSTDSYRASCGTDGAFTGAITHLGNPLFFKENCVHKVYGSYPANFQIQATACRGVEKGSDRSLAIVNETLFYKSRGCVCAYDGSLPVEISGALGAERYENAVAGSHGNKYYICMQGSDGDWHLFVYDVAKSMWHKEDDFRAAAFCSYKAGLYAIDHDSGYIVIMEGAEQPTEEKVRWMAQTGPIGTDMPDTKYISRLTLRMSLDLDAKVHLTAQYDSAGDWEYLGTMTGTTLRSFSIPVRPRRCDHLRLRIEGEGEAKMLFTIAHELTHFIRQWSPAKFKVLANFLNEQYGVSGKSVSALVEEQIAKAKRNGRTISQDVAYEEVVADSMESMLIDGNVVQVMADLKQQDKSLWQKICDWFKDLAADLKAIVDAYTGKTPDSVEGKLVADMQDVVVVLESLYADALVDASENRQTAPKAEKNTTQEGGAKFQTRNVNGGQVVWIENSGFTNAQLRDPAAIAQYIAQHIGDVYRIIESGQKVYIGKDLLGEYTHSKYTSYLQKKKPALLNAKNKASSSLGEMIEIATNRRWEATKHTASKDAKYGMYRYDTKFAFPVKDQKGNVTTVKAYDAELLIRNASNGKKYLYDIVNVKEDTANAIDLRRKEARKGNYAAATQSGVSTKNVAQESAEVNKKFSMREPVERTKNLVALHNLTEDKLEKALKLGGFPMPSIAITKADIPHTNFGDITLVFGSEVIDPKKSKNNVVYSADAWTPTFPRIEYEADDKIASQVHSRLSGLSKQVDEYFRRDLGRVTYDMEDILNRYDGEEGLIQYALDNYGLKAAYLEERGEHIQPETRQEEVTLDVNPEMEDKYLRILEVLDIYTPEQVSDLILKDVRDKHGKELEEIYPGVTKSALRLGRVLNRIRAYLSGVGIGTEYKTVTDATATNMPATLLDAISTLRSMPPEGEFGYDREMAAQDLLHQVYDSYWSVSTLYTVADVKQREIDRLKSAHHQRMTDLRETHRENTAKLKQQHSAELKRVREEMRAAADAKQQKIVQKYQESRKKNVESRKKTEMRRKIRKTIRDLDKLLNRGDKKRNVKDGMKDFAATALASAEVLFIDEYSNEDMVRDGVGITLEQWEAELLSETRNLLQQRKDLFSGIGMRDEMDNLIAGDTDSYDKRMNASEKLDSKIQRNMRRLSGVFARERTRLSKATVSSILDMLAKEYKSLGYSDDLYIRGATDESVYQYLLALSEEIGGTIIKDMSLSQLESLHKAYTMVLTTVRNANKMFSENLKHTREELGIQTINEVRQAGKGKKITSAARKALNSFSWNNEKPVYALERIGSPTLTRLFENVRAGEDTWARDMIEARSFRLAQARKFKYPCEECTP